MHSLSTTGRLCFFTVPNQFAIKIQITMQHYTPVQIKEQITYVYDDFFGSVLVSKFYLVSSAISCQLKAVEGSFVADLDMD